jgi:AcrR family transcriptional regulator
VWEGWGEVPQIEDSSQPLSAYRLPRGRHGIPPELVEENQRWRLLGATAEVLAERGYTRIRVADIAAHARLSRGTLYEYFDDLADCLLAAYEMAASCVLDIASSACEQEGEWSVRLRVALDGVLEFLAEEPALAHLLGAEAPIGVPAIGASRERLITKLVEMGVERHSLEGALALVSARVAAGETAQLPELAPQLIELIPLRGPDAGAPGP